MKRLILFLLIQLTICSAFAQQLIEQVSKTNNFYDIPFSKYKLDNGLTIILHQDTTVSNVYVNMLYKVGSANEVDGKRGYAHFFEHLMFAGTKTLSKSELWDLFPKTNSTLMNAETSYENTMYEEEVPANYLERALWLESQRLRFTPEFMNENNVAIQKQIILNEMSMSNDDNIYGIIGKEERKILYDKQYSYHHPVIGYKEDIQKATLNDIRDFFIKWYVPNNAILSVSGNFDIKNTLSLINKYFSDIPKKELPDITINNLTNLQSPITKDLQYDVNFPVYSMFFPTVKRWNIEEAPLDALAYILSQRDIAKRFVNYFNPNVYQQALAINMNHPCNKFGGEFQILFRTNGVVNNPGYLVESAIDMVQKISIQPQHINVYEKYFKNLMYDRFSTIRDIAYQLDEYELLLGTPNGLPVEWKRNMSLTKEQLLGTLDKYIHNKPFVAINILPYTDKQKTKGRKKLSNSIATAKKDDLWNVIGDDVEKKIDLSKKNVPPQATQLFTQFDFWKAKLPNHIQILGSSGNENIPISRLSVNIKAGLLYNKIEYAGMSQLYVYILSNILQYNDIQTSLKNIGASVELNTNSEDITLQLTFPDDQLRRTVTLLDSILFHASIAPQDYVTLLNFYNKLSTEHIKEDAFFTTEAMLRKTFYTPIDIFNYTNYGSESTIKGIYNVYNFVEEVRSLLSSQVEICYVGNLSKDQVLDEVSLLSGWNTDTIRVIQKMPVSIQPSDIDILFYDKIDASQSDIDIGIKTVTNQSVNNYTTLQLVNYILGETFTSRLNIKLREEKGLAYFCSSEIYNSAYYDIMHIKTDINIEKTDSAILILIRELNNFIINGVSEEELEKAKTSLIYRINEVPEASDNKLTYLQYIISKENYAVYSNKQTQLIKMTDITHVNQFIKDYFKPNTYQIAIVSDKIKVLPQLKKLHYTIKDFTDKLY